MRQAKVFFRNEEAGVLIQHDNGTFTFRYHDVWFLNSAKCAISPTLPKKTQEHHANNLFPFFYNMLPEGENKLALCNYHRLDKNDHFGLLMIIAKNDTIGAVTVKKDE